MDVLIKAFRTIASEFPQIKLKLLGYFQTGRNWTASPAGTRGLSFSNRYRIPRRCESWKAR